MVLRDINLVIPEHILINIGPSSREGGNTFYISFNIGDRFLKRFVLGAFCHKKTENNFEQKRYIKSSHSGFEKN